jgi:hypothetical protein
VKFSGLIASVGAAISATAEMFAERVRRGERSVNQRRTVSHFAAVDLRPVSAPRVRKFKRVTGGPSGNAHDRRKARRSGRAFAWYLAHLKARAAAL